MYTFSRIGVLNLQHAGGTSAHAGGMVKRTRARATADIDGLSADEIVSRYACLPRSVSGRLECHRTIKHSVSDCAVEDA